MAQVFGPANTRRTEMPSKLKKNKCVAIKYENFLYHKRLKNGYAYCYGRYPLPFKFERCDAIDALLNSTKLVFGDLSQGQVVALAEAVAAHNQNLPGFCCMDSPDLSGIWGEPVSPSCACLRPKFVLAQ